METENITGEKLQHVIKKTFGVDKPTPEQIKYVITMLSPSAYGLAHHRIKGQPMTFSQSSRLGNPNAHRPWQKQIIDDKHPNKVIIKARQLGLSEVGVLEMLWFADSHSSDAVKCLYTFPTVTQLQSFIQTRLDPNLHQGYYNDILDPNIDSLKQKKIRNSFMIFRTSSKSGAVEGVDIDYLSLDEYDRVPKAAEQSAIESMSSSNFKVVRRWSTPTVPNWGIHDLFLHSDQKHYQHKCANCGYWNKMKYADYDPDNLENSGNIKMINPDGYHELAREVEDGTFDFVCQKCGKHLDRWFNGKWIADNPESKATSGYMISQMNAVWISADELKRKELTAKVKAEFYNYVLGEPYQDVSLSIFPKDIMTHRRKNLPERITFGRGDYKYISVGIDWGKYHWISVMGEKENGQRDLINLFHVKETVSGEDLTADVKSIVMYLKRYNPDIILADTGYSGTKIKMLANEFGRTKVYGATFNPNQSATNGNEVAPAWSEQDEKFRSVKLDKLSHNMALMESIKNGRLGFWQKNDNELQTYIVHWGNVVIRDVEDEKKGVWEKKISRKGDDHYAQSSVYANVGMNRLTEYASKNSDTSFAYTEISGDTSRNGLPENFFDK